MLTLVTNNLYPLLNTLQYFFLNYFSYNCDVRTLWMKSSSPIRRCRAFLDSSASSQLCPNSDGVLQKIFSKHPKVLRSIGRTFTLTRRHSKYSILIEFIDWPNTANHIRMPDFEVFGGIVIVEAIIYYGSVHSEWMNGDNAFSQSIGIIVFERVAGMI
jgi:hypothetical protein